MSKGSKNKKKNKDPSLSFVDMVKLVSIFTGGGIFLLLTGSFIYFGVSLALFKYDAFSCNKGDQSKCDKLLNYDDYILDNNAESVTNPYFKKIYDDYKSQEYENINELLNELNNK